jgi:hypothetical protein
MLRGFGCVAGFVLSQLHRYIWKRVDECCLVVPLIWGLSGGVRLLCILVLALWFLGVGVGCVGGAAAGLLVLSWVLSWAVHGWLVA